MKLKKKTYFLFYNFTKSKYKFNCALLFIFGLTFNQYYIFRVVKNA